MGKIYSQSLLTGFLPAFHGVVPRTIGWACFEQIQPTAPDGKLIPFSGAQSGLSCFEDNFNTHLILI